MDHERGAASDSRIQRCAELRVVGDKPLGAGRHCLVGDRGARPRKDLDRTSCRRRYREVQAAVLLVRISTESRCPRRMVKELGEMSPAQDPDSIAAWPGAEKVYGVPQVVTLGEVCVLSAAASRRAEHEQPDEQSKRTHHVPTLRAAISCITVDRHGRSCSFDRLAEAMRLCFGMPGDRAVRGASGPAREKARK